MGSRIFAIILIKKQYEKSNFIYEKNFFPQPEKE